MKRLNRRKEDNVVDIYKGIAKSLATNSVKPIDYKTAKFVLDVDVIEKELEERKK